MWALYIMKPTFNGSDKIKAWISRLVTLGGMHFYALGSVLLRR